MLPALLTLLLLVASSNCEQDLAFAADGSPQILQDGLVPTPAFPVSGPVMSNFLLPQRHNPGVPAPGPVKDHHLLWQRHNTNNLLPLQLYR